MFLVKIISTSINALNQRVAKFFRFGRSDVQSSLVSAPYGVDSNPVKDMVALYSSTGKDGKTVIIGYINKNSIANIGELRLFSTNSDAEEQNYIYLKNDGIIEVGGNTDNLVRFSDLKVAFDLFVNNFNTHTHLSSAPGTPTPPPVVPSTANIDSAKINEIKTK